MVAGVTTLVSSAARTASGGSGDQVGFHSSASLRVALSVTAASGTVPTLDVYLEDTLDGTNYNTLHQFTQATGTS
jgi:hypothetical protein